MMAQQFRYAVLFYMAINSTAKVQECYQQIILNESKVEYETRMELAEYLTTIILFNQAKEMFKLASDSTDNLTKKKQALLKMI